MSSEVKVGIFVVVGLAVLLAVFEFVGEIPFLTKDYTLKTYFQSVGELREGNPVKLSGVEVGKVSKIAIEDSKIAVTAKVKEGFMVKQDSVASVRLTSLLGTSYLHITFGSPDSPAAQDSFVLKSEEPADINQILAKVESSISSIQSAFSGFDALGGIDKDKVASIIDNLDKVLAGAERGEGTFGKLLKDDALYNEAKEALSNINRVAAAINQGKGTLGKLISDDSLYVETKKTMENLGQVASKLNQSEGTLGKLLKDDTLYNEVTGAATSLNKILKKVERGEGTLGKLVVDDSLYFDTKNAVKKVEKSVEIQEDLAPLNTLGAAFGILTLF
ncbi:MAG: MlaD family protein [Deltaproteobacteria bacterium]